MNVIVCARVKIKWALYCVTSNIRVRVNVRVKIKWTLYCITFEVEFSLKIIYVKCIHKTIDKNEIKLKLKLRFKVRARVCV